jgi:hypothetical protein
MFSHAIKRLVAASGFSSNGQVNLMISSSGFTDVYFALHQNVKKIHFNSIA